MEEIQAWIREDAPPEAPGMLTQLGLAAGVAGEVLGPLLACVMAWPLASAAAAQLVRGDAPDPRMLMETAMFGSLAATLGLIVGLVALAWGVRSLLDRLGTDRGAADLARARLEASCRRLRPGEDGVGLLLAGGGVLSRAPLRTPLTWMVLLGATAGAYLAGLAASSDFVTEFLGMRAVLWLLPLGALAAWATLELAPLPAFILGVLGSTSLYFFGGLAGLGWVDPSPAFLVGLLPLVAVTPAILRPLLGTPAIRVGPAGLQRVHLRGGRVVWASEPCVPARIRMVPGPRGPAWEVVGTQGERETFYPVDGEAPVLRAALKEVGLGGSVVGVGRRTRVGDELGAHPGTRVALPLAGALALGLVVGEWSRRQAVLAAEVVPIFREARELWDVTGKDLDGPARARWVGVEGVSVRNAAALASIAQGEVEAARVSVDQALELAQELPVWREGAEEWIHDERASGSILSELTLLAHLDAELAPWRALRRRREDPGRALEALDAAIFCLDPDQGVGGVRAGARSTAMALARALEQDPSFHQARVVLTLRDLAAPHLMLDQPRPGRLLGPGAGPAAVEALLDQVRRAKRRLRSQAEVLAGVPGWAGLATLVGPELPATFAREAWGALARAHLRGDDLGPWRRVGRGLRGPWVLHGSDGPRKRYEFEDGTTTFHRADRLEVLRTALMDPAGFPASWDELLQRIEEPDAWREPIRIGPFEAEDWLADERRFWETSRRAHFRPQDLPEDVRARGLSPAASQAGFGERQGAG